MPQDDPEAYLDPNSPYYDPSKYPGGSAARPSLYYNPAKHPQNRTRNDPSGSMDMLLAALAKAIGGGAATQQIGGAMNENKGIVDYMTTPDEPPEELSEEEADEQIGDEPVEEDEFVSVVQDAAGHELNSDDFGDFLNSQEGATVYDIYESEGMTPGTADQIREAYKLFRDRNETVPDDLIQREGKSDSLNRMW